MNKIDYSIWYRTAAERGWRFPREYLIEKQGELVGQLFVNGISHYLPDDNKTTKFFYSHLKHLTTTNSICLLEADKLRLQSFAIDYKDLQSGKYKDLNIPPEHTPVEQRVFGKCVELGLPMGTLLSKPVEETYTEYAKRYDEDSVALSYTFFVHGAKYYQSNNMEIDFDNLPELAQIYAEMMYFMKADNSAIKVLLTKPYEEFIKSVNKTTFQKFREKFYLHSDIIKDKQNLTFKLNGERYWHAYNIHAEHAFNMNEDMAENLHSYVSTNEGKVISAFMGAAHVSGVTHLASNKLKKKGVKLLRMVPWKLHIKNLISVGE